MTDVRPLLRTDTKGPVYYLLEMSGIPFGLMTDTYGWGAPPHGEPNLACKIVILSRFVAVRLAYSKKYHYFRFDDDRCDSKNAERARHTASSRDVEAVGCV